MRWGRTVLCVAGMGLVVAALGQSPRPSRAVDVTKRITYSAQGTLLERVLRLSAKQGIPAGIVIRGRSLCDDTGPRVYTELAFGKVLDDVLVASGYEWHLRNGLLQIRPSGPPTPLEGRVLRDKLATFGGMRTTIQGLGIVLAGMISTIQHPVQGYAGDILSSPSAENVPIFTLHNVTVEEAANYIVSQGSKGAWILYRRADEVSLRTLGYKDDLNRPADPWCTGESK